jgi:branched-chain amino acid transport system ATP-binding protein
MKREIAESKMKQKVMEVNNLHAYYGRSHILQGVTLSVGAGEVVALLGRNGAGKTTTFRAIIGLLRQTEGSIRFDGAELVGMDTHRIARQGIAYVPSGRRSFAQLTVEENLQVAMEGRLKRKNSNELEKVYEMFPALKKRMTTPAGVLSGGENQMLKMACAFLTEPAILLLDEPTEGLAPIVVSELAEHIRVLAATGVGILLAEQNAHFAFSLSKRAYVLNKGVVQMAGNVEDLSQNKEILFHLGV